MPCRTLPAELVCEVLDTFVALFPSHAARLPNLASFSRIDKTWGPIATAWLYRNLYLDSTSRTGILDALESNPSLAPHVRILTLSGGKLDPAEFARLQAVLTQCTNVRSLSYHCFDATYLEDLTSFIASAFPGLKYLRADQSQHLYDLLSKLHDLEELIASAVDFPATHALIQAQGTPLPPSRPATPGETSPASSGTVTPTRPIRPSFRLKRFDSGSSPSSLNFHLLTFSSLSTLRTLDLPISSLTSQDLGSFQSLTSLTLTLAERYISANEDLAVPRQPGQPGTGRDDKRCLRRLKRILRRAEEAGVPLRRLEVYEPRYAATSAFKGETFEQEDVLSAVPSSVVELDLSSTAVELSYLTEAFSRTGLLEDGQEGAEGQAEEEVKPPVCTGLRSLVLGMGSVGSAHEVRGALEVLARRGLMVRWA
ncbi:hypothetical protein JCM8547_008275 [Rhodosporidiobolus lusitaniae]